MRLKHASPHSEADPQVNKRCERQKVSLQEGHRSHVRGARMAMTFDIRMEFGRERIEYNVGGQRERENTY